MIPIVRFFSYIFFHFFTYKKYFFFVAGSYNGVGKSLELDGKCLYLSFARPLSRRQKEFSNADIKTNNPYKEKVLEWLCNCGVLNYHGRNSCRKCFTEKKDKTITVLTSDNLVSKIIKL